MLSTPLTKRSYIDTLHLDSPWRRGYYENFLTYRIAPWVAFDWQSRLMMGLFICLFYKLLAWLTGWFMDLTIAWFRLSIVWVPGFFCLIVFTYLNGLLLNWVASMLVVVYVIAAHYQWLCGCLLRPTPNCWHYYQQHFSVARLALSLQMSRGNCVPGAETRARARTLYSDPLHRLCTVRLMSTALVRAPHSCYNHDNGITQSIDARLTLSRPLFITSQHGRKTISGILRNVIFTT